MRNFKRRIQILNTISVEIGYSMRGNSNVSIQHHRRFRKYSHGGVHVGGAAVGQLPERGGAGVEIHLLPERTEMSAQEYKGPDAGCKIPRIQLQG